MNKLTPALLSALLLPGSVALAAGANTSALEKKVAELEKKIDSMHHGRSAKGMHGKPSAKHGWLKRKFVKSGNRKMQVTLSGHINRAMVYVDDGQNGELVNVDNDKYGSRLQLLGTADLNDSVTIGSKFQFGVDSNASTRVNQFDTNTGAGTYNGRIYEIYADWQRFGRFTFGRGSLASDHMAELSLNGASMFEFSYASSPAEGFFIRDSNETSTAFRNRVTAGTATTVTAPTVADVFDNMDGGREDRARYDSPMWRGFQASGAYAARGIWDAALTHNWENDNLQTLLAIAYRHDASRDAFVTGSAAVLHKPSGLNAAYNGARANRADTATATTNLDSSMNYYQVGWNAMLNDLGQTSFALGYYMGEDTLRKRDESRALGFAINQTLESVGAEIYFIAKTYDYDDRQATRNWDNLKVLAIGGLVRF